MTDGQGGYRVPASPSVTKIVNEPLSKVHPKLRNELPLLYPIVQVKRCILSKFSQLIL